MNKKIITATPEGLERLQAVERVQNGELRHVVAKAFNVHYTTITEWCDMYEQGGVERLNVPRKPRPRHVLDAEELATLTLTAPAEYRPRLERLFRLANGEQLKKVAADTAVSVQSIMKDRRLYEQGKLPLTVIL